VSDNPSLLPSSAEFIKTKVIDNKEIATGVFLISLERHFDFDPGQVIGIHFKPAPDARLYSIASGVNDEHIKVLFDIQPGGFLSPVLAECKSGDGLFVTTPFGWFTCNEKPAWWIASGTGIAPFASMFFSGLGKDKILIHGGRTTGSFYFQEDFSAALKENYIRCCPGENKEGIYSGRLTAWLKEQENLPADQAYYICGRAEMVVEVREILINKGIRFTNIHSEIYF
jgi:ferredoxin/flavodoxin---NADP+ reductase